MTLCSECSTEDPAVCRQGELLGFWNRGAHALIWTLKFGVEPGRDYLRADISMSPRTNLQSENFEWPKFFGSANAAINFCHNHPPPGGSPEIYT